MTKSYIAQERTRDGRVLLHHEFATRQEALAFWDRLVSAGVKARAYEPDAPRRLVLLGPDAAVKP